MKPTLEQLSAALDRAKLMGFNISISLGRYGGDTDHCSCRLSQTSHAGGKVDVAGDDTSLEEAVRKCFSNFPENPLDGTGWKNNRLAAQTPDPVDAEFTEVPKSEEKAQ